MFHPLWEFQSFCSLLIFANEKKGEWVIWEKTRSCHPDSQPKETKENMKLGETKRNVLSPTRQSKLPITRKSKPTEERWCTKRKWSLVSKELHKRSSKWFFFHFLPFFFFQIISLTLKTGLPTRLSSCEVIHKVVLLDSGSSHSSVSFYVDTDHITHANYLVNSNIKESQKFLPPPRQEFFQRNHQT